MNSVKKTIGWADYTINPIKGLCPVGCSYCYARRMYKRFHWNTEIRFSQLVFFSTDNIPKGSRVFVGSTMELFGKWVKKEWMETILTICQQREDIVWIFLTKCPQNLPPKFPDNCWVGCSVTANGDMTRAYYGLANLKAGKRFISFEPLHGQIGMDDHVRIKEWLDWVIIGAQTPYSVKTAPRIEWVKEIVVSADKYKIPVFLKSNLHKVFEADARRQIQEGTVPQSLIPRWASNKERYIPHLRREFPHGH